MMMVTVIIVITDGAHNCEPNACEVASRLKAEGKDLNLVANVIAAVCDFSPLEEAKEELETLKTTCVAKDVTLVLVGFQSNLALKLTPNLCFLFYLSPSLSLLTHH